MKQKIVPLLLGKTSQIFLIGCLVFGFSLFIGITKPNESINVINTKQTIGTPKDFALDGIIYDYSVLDVGDRVSTFGKEVGFTFNRTTSLTIAPHTELIVLNLGKTPMFQVISGQIKVQTIFTAYILSNQNLAMVEQGGLKVQTSPEASQFGSYFGQNTIEIYKGKQKVLSYELPLKKSIRISSSADTSEWGKVRLAKLHKEIHFQAFLETVNRDAFFVEIPQYTVALFSPLQDMLTWNPQRNNSVYEAEAKALFTQLQDHIKQESPSLIKQDVRAFSQYSLSSPYQSLPDITLSINNPLLRYTYDTALQKILSSTTPSLQKEIFYFYSMMSIKSEETKEKFFTMVKQKIITHKNNVAQLEEDYNLITAFIEAYPDIVTNDIVDLKHSTELLLLTSVNTDIEKTDIILTGLERDMNLVISAIENNRGDIAENIYSSMLVNTSGYHSQVISTYRKNYAHLESQVLTMLDFYKNTMHGSAFSPSEFANFQERRNQELEALSLFQKNVQVLRSRFTEGDFDSVIKAMQEVSINVQSENISYVYKGGNLVYIEKAFLMPNVTKNTFHCVFNTETHTISGVRWDGDLDVLPSLEDEVPLSRFQEVYAQALTNKLTPPQSSENQKTPIKDWIETAGIKSLNETREFDTAMKKRLTKEKLLSYGIASKESSISVSKDIAEVSDATLQFIDDKKTQVTVTFSVRFNVKSWDILSLYLNDFPKLRTPVPELITLKETIISLYKTGASDKEITDAALATFNPYMQEADSAYFSVLDATGRIVKVENLPFILKSDDKSDMVLLRLNGEYNTQTGILLSAKVTFGEKSISLTNVPMEDITKKIGQAFFTSPVVQYTSTTE